MNIETLPCAVQEYIHNLIQEKNKLEIKYQILEEKYTLVLFQKFCKKAETVSADQLALFEEESEQTKAPEEKDETVTIKSYTRKKTGRKAIDESLPRQIIMHDISEEEKTCACGCALKCIGEESSEKLNVIPEQMWVEKHVRPKYACPSCEGTADEESPAVKIAPVEKTILPKSIATPGLLSFILVNKFVDHLPYYRQEKRFERIGVHISRQDMCNWQIKAMHALEPLFVLLKKQMKNGSVLNMDETTVQVMNEAGRSDTQKSYMWLCTGGSEGKKVFWYEYKPTRAASHIHSFLENFSGYLQTDGYQAYETAMKEYPDIKHVGCFAHARRKFFEASKGMKNPASPMEGIKWIKKLYDVEDHLRIKYTDANEFLLQRKKETEPILSGFKSWLDKKALHTAPQGLMGKAIFYTLGQWEKLIAYLEHKDLTPDNNISENAIRPFVVGRKNWLFSGSPTGAETSAKVYTLVETAKHCKVNLHDYLRIVFEKAAHANTEEDWNKLLPWNLFVSVK
ncbi:MAG TPA: IS66 family transposase [Treponemataceae bacterium]|nr:IS66 family transposase [Treponemataceae bacterium]